MQTEAPGVTFRIISSGGVEIQSGHAATMGWFAISIVAGDNKPVLLRLNLDDPSDGLGVHVHVDALRIPLSTLAAHKNAAQLHVAAQTHHNSLRAEEVRRAIDEYRRAAAAWARCGDLYGEAIALGGEGESEFELSQYSLAARTLDRAAGLNPSNIYLHAWIDHIEARSFLDEWESERAEHLARESLNLANTIKDPATVAIALADLAEAHYWISDPSTEAYAQDALDRARESGLPLTVAYCLRAQALFEEELSHLPQALALMTEADKYFRRAGDERLTLESTEELTGIESRMGDTFRALIQFSELVPLSKKAGNLVEYGILIENIGNAYVDLNRFADAEAYFMQADNAFSRAGFQSGKSMVQGKICDVELRFQQPANGSFTDKLKSALKNCSMSAATVEKIKDPYRIAIAEYQLGRVYQQIATICRNLRLNRKANQENERASDLFKTAAEISHSFDEKRWESWERIGLGEVLNNLGKKQEARDELEEALLLSERGEDSESTVDARYDIARWYAEDGKDQNATEELKPALERIEEARTRVSDSTLQASYFAAERKVYELAVELRMRRSGGDAEGLEMSEKSRARGLLDALSARSSAGNGERGDGAQANLMRSNMAVDKAFDKRLELMVGGPDKGKLETNATSLTEAIGKLELAEDAARFPPESASTPAKTLTAEEIENESLRSGDTYLEYELGEEQSFLWVVDGRELHSYLLPKRQDIEGMVKDWRALVTRSGMIAGKSPSPENSRNGAAGSNERRSLELACTLLGGGSAVTADMKRLIVVPDGDLAMLPFGALPETAALPNGKCGAAVHAVPLAAGHEIVLTPSLSVFLSKKPPVDNAQYKYEVAIVADPIFDLEDAREQQALNSGRNWRAPAGIPATDTSIALPRLVKTGMEADEIEKIFGKGQTLKKVRFEASVQTVLSPEMQDSRIWHLATHGVYDESTPEFSGLVFSRFGSDLNPAYGFLKAQDIEHLNLRAQLVVLSACDTAAGENLSGEGVMGLSYSFLRAGARQIVSTLWSIDDEVTTHLMRKFYQTLKTNGYDAAASLRESQLEVMREHDNKDPYYWAAFQLTSVGN